MINEMGQVGYRRRRAGTRRVRFRCTSDAGCNQKVEWRIGGIKGRKSNGVQAFVERLMLIQLHCLLTAVFAFRC